MHSWKLAFKNCTFRRIFILSFLFLGLLLFFFARFLNFIEQRQGHSFYDPLLNFFKPQDVSYLIFFITYAACIAGIVYALTSPFRTLHLCQMYVLLTLFRMTTLMLVPLDPPTTIIPLQDAFLQNTFYSGNNLKDLFFSGHTSTLFLFFFFTHQRLLKWLFFISALSVSCCLILQHVHYTADLIVAPGFAYLAYQIVIKRMKFYEDSELIRQE